MLARNGRWLWATICEIEPGLYQAIYSNTGSAEEEEEKLPRYEAGVCASEEKRRFEHGVGTYGFGVITWLDVIAADLALPRIDSEGSGARKPLPLAGQVGMTPET